MPQYKVSCEATQECEMITAPDAMFALAAYLKGYQTRNSDGEPVAAGERYSTILVRDDDNVFASVDIIADGRGGVQPQ